MPRSRCLAITLSALLFSVGCQQQTATVDLCAVAVTPIHVIQGSS
jgi:hypothetical protein